MKKMCVLIFTVIVMASCEAIFVENISDTTVNTLAPSDGTTVAAGRITFSWEAVEDAENHQLQIATPTFTNASQIIIDTVLIGTTSVNKEIPIGNYQWRVKAANSEYETTYTTNAFSVN
ncbi:MAG: hypothetical protein P8K77_05345 [Polaribacter sp.]|nr:hypothetical protein [Polaribacter sp.]